MEQLGDPGIAGDRLEFVVDIDQSRSDGDEPQDEVDTEASEHEEVHPSVVVQVDVPDGGQDLEDDNEPGSRRHRAQKTTVLGHTVRQSQEPLGNPYHKGSTPEDGDRQYHANQDLRRKADPEVHRLGADPEIDELTLSRNSDRAAQYADRR